MCLATPRLFALACLIACAPSAPLPAASRIQDDPPAGETAPAQDAEPDPDEAAKVRKAIQNLIDKARSGRAMVRPQAADRLLRVGQPAADMLRAYAGETNAELAALGKELVEVMGKFGDADLRARLWLALDDPDFPWRPAAAKGVAAKPVAEEVERFDAMLEDPLSAVRYAGVLGLGALDAKDRKERVAARLQIDPSDDVRRELAAQLHLWGESWALWYLVEDLRRTDTFFGASTGDLARQRTLTTMGKLFGERPTWAGMEPLDSEANVAHLAAIEGMVQELAGERPELPALAQAGGPIEGERLGIELLSCRRGEFYLRWTDDDRLLVGQGNPAIVQLPEGTTERLLEQARSSFERLEGRVFFGEAGCDTETLYAGFLPERPVVVRLSKGPEAVPNLRPDPLTFLAAHMLGSLPREADEDPRLTELWRRMADALEGGGRQGRRVAEARCRVRSGGIAPP